MIRLANLNNISKELEDEIPSFKPGDIRTFQMCHGTRIEDADTGKVEIAYGKFSMFCKDTIFDPYARDGKGDTIHIGIPSTFDKNGNVESWYLFFPCRDVVKFLGKFDLNADIPEDVDVFRFLWLSNDLKNNPHRNKRNPPRFEMLTVPEKVVPLVRQETDGEGHVTVKQLSKTAAAKKIHAELQAEIG